MSVVTIVKSLRPAEVGKVYSLGSTGELVKTAVASIARGLATSYDADTAEELANILRYVTEQTDTVLCPAAWQGDDDGRPFTVVAEGELARLLGRPVGAPELAGIHEVAGERIAARLRRGLTPANWLHVDCDNPPGILNEWAALGIQARLEMLDAVLPGLSAARRVELRGSSARVVRPGEEPGGATHAWVQVDDGEALDRLQAFLRVQTALRGLSFQSPRFSRATGEVVGHARRTLIDLSVLTGGRLVFYARPSLSADMIAGGWSVADADVRILDGDPLAISGIELPSEEDLRAYRRMTGEELRYVATGSASLSTVSRGELTLETEIESRGVVRPLWEWLDGMADGEALRCEAPFRASVSEAAFIRRTGSRQGFIHDVGVNCSYMLAPEEVATEQRERTRELGEALRRVLPTAAVEEAVAASEERRAGDAVMTAASAELALDERAVVLTEDGMEHLAVGHALRTLPDLRVRVFRHAGGLVHVSRSREVRMFDPEGHATLVRVSGMERVTPPWLKVELAHRLDFQKTRYRRLQSIDPPPGVVSGVLASDLSVVPSISGIISTPTMRPDGSLLLSPGFDDTTGFWLDSDLAVSVPETPTRGDAVAALGVLCELLAGFPMDDLSESCALAHMLGAVLRPAFPSMPGLMIEAPVAGSGKSYLTSVIGYLAHGVEPAVSNWPKGEELNKHLHALLLAGVPFIAFDNANGVEIGGELICTMISQPQVRIRPLGVSEELTASTTGTVVTVNGNHPRILEDATQRFITCYLRPNEANPRERVFASDPLDMLRRDRGRYVSACLTVARAYVVAGRPGAVDYGSFMAWSRLVRSALIWAGYDDVLVSTREAMADDPDLQRVNTLVGLIARFAGVDVDFTVGTFLAAVQARDAVQMQVIGGLVGAASSGPGIASEATIKLKLGHFLRSKVHDRIVDIEQDSRVRQVRLTKQGVTNGSVRWSLSAMRVETVS